MSVKGTKTFGFLTENYYLWCGDAREGVLEATASCWLLYTRKACYSPEQHASLMKEKQNTQVSE